MTTNEVDPRHAVPLYHQIMLLLRDEIHSGVRPFGMAMPTEEQLARSHGVSRITARRALAELAVLGLVERRRRTGTRVIYRAPLGPIDGDIDQAVESLLAFGRETRVEVLEVADCPAGPVISERLAIGPEDMVTRAVRLRFDGSEPLGEVVSYVATARNIPIDRQSLLTTPILALVRSASCHIGAGTQTISALSADAALAALLKIDVRAPLLRIERTLKDDEGRPLLFTSASYRADRYRISIDLHAPVPPIAKA